MNDRELLLSLKAQIEAQLGVVPPAVPVGPVVPVQPPPPPYVPPSGTGPIETNVLWRRGTFWRAQFSGIGDTKSATYTVPAGVSYPPGQVQLYGDNAFANGYLRVTVDGVLTGLGEPVPVNPGTHTITATCIKTPAEGSGAFANIQITNQ